MAAVQRVTNGSSHANSYTFECGAFGSIMFTVPIGGKFQFTPGSENAAAGHGDRESRNL